MNDLECKNIVIDSYFKNNKTIEININNGSQVYKTFNRFMLEFSLFQFKEIFFKEKIIKVVFDKSQIKTFICYLEQINNQDMIIDLIDLIIDKEVSNV